MMAAEWCVTFQLPPNRCYVTARPVSRQLLLTPPNNKQDIARPARNIPHSEPESLSKLFSQEVESLEFVL